MKKVLYLTERPVVPQFQNSLICYEMWNIFMLTQNWKLNIAIIKIEAKKKKTFDLMPTKPKTLLSKISKEHRFGNNHNHVMLIIQKSFLWEQHH